MLRFEIDYDFGKTTTVKGTEIIKVSGKVPFYKVEYIPEKSDSSEEENKADISEDEDKEQDKGEEPEEMPNLGMDDPFEEYNKYKEEHPDIYESFKPKSYFITRNRELAKLKFCDIEDKVEIEPYPAKIIEDENGGRPTIITFEGEIKGWIEEGEELQWTEEYNLGVEMAKFLNFDIDNFMQGEAEFVFPEDDDFDLHIQKIRLYKNHDISNPLNRNAILSYLISDEHNMNSFLNLPMPVFIRMFSGMLIDYEKWEYYEEGIKYIKYLQEEFKNYCNTYFILKEGDSRTPIEVYCDENNIPRDTTVTVKRVRRQLREYVKDTQKRVSEYMNGADIPNVMEEALLGELYAMLCKDNVFFKKCKVCGRYYIGNKNSLACNHLYFEPKNRIKSKTEEKGYLVDKISEYDMETKKDTGEIFNILVSDCSAIASNGVYREKVKKDAIRKISFYSSTRLRKWINDNDKRVSIQLNNIHHDLDKELLAIHNKVIIENEKKYISLYEVAKDEEEKKKILSEYNSLLVDEVNSRIAKYSKIKVKRLNFTNKKGRFKPPKEKKTKRR